MLWCSFVVDRVCGSFFDNKGMICSVLLNSACYMLLRVVVLS